jgi:carbamoyl-phosphate synthase small subunit
MKNSQSLPPERKPIFLVLEDGSAFGGFSFGAAGSTTGEVVFNTGMVGYPESFTDPSYRGQILVLTYPLIGNYGVPKNFGRELSHSYESSLIHLKGLVVSEYSAFHHHWNAARGLSDLLVEQGIVGIEGVDTRAIAKRLRERGTMLGCITDDPANTKFVVSPTHVVSEVSIREPCVYEAVYELSPSLCNGAVGRVDREINPLQRGRISKTTSHGKGKKRVAVVDCGCKNTIIRSLLNRGIGVVRVPWDFDVMKLDVNGVLFSNGPGDPLACDATIKTAKRVIDSGLPAFGICLGNQILALAAGSKTYKLKFGHRGQNQPCLMAGSKRCFITSQNHGYAVDVSTLPEGWEEWFINVNDGTNEGLRHATKPIMSVQFHPEAMPGPVDTGFLFDEFVGMLK